MPMSQPINVPPGTKIRLEEFDARYCENLDRAAAESLTTKYTGALDDLTHRLYAENRRCVLLILQGMDTSGKDGTIRSVLENVNPACCRVVSFKAPSHEELRHDFLWRIHKSVPRHGELGVFNRSQYEDVGIVRVHKLVPKAVWSTRYESINAFEKTLVDNGTALIKIYLHISLAEQKERLLSRLNDPTKRWKFNKQDLEERKLWPEYTEAYNDALTKCNTEHAPWHIVPADRKWYRNLVVSRLLFEALERMNPQYPPAEPGLENVLFE